MRTRIGGLVVIVMLAGPACGGDERGPTGATPGATGATGSAEIAEFNVVTQDPEAGNTLSFSGLSCNGIDGPYDVTIAIEGNATGETTATFSLDENGTGTMDWSLDATGSDGAATLSGAYDVEVSGQEESSLVFSGVTTVEDSSGTRTFNLSTDDVPVEEGTGACTGPN